MSKLNLCILFGGCSTEYEVSLESAYGVITNIDREKYDIIQVGITRDGEWYNYYGDVEDICTGKWCENKNVMNRVCVDPSRGSSSLLVFADGSSNYGKIHIDVAFPVMHGAFGEDGTMQGLFEIAGIPCVGSGCASSAVCMDKAFTKMVINNYNIPQAKSLVRTIDLKKIAACAEYRDEIISEVENTFTYPIFIKPACSGSSRGVSKVKSRETAIEAAVLAAENDFTGKIIIEEGIIGKEVEIAVLGNSCDALASVCGEIDPGAEFYDYETKYKNSTASYFIPARINDETSEKIKNYALKIYNALSCKGLSRIDFFVRTLSDGTEEIIFNEINTIPGFTPISMYPKLFIHGGMTYAELTDKLIRLALE